MKDSIKKVIIENMELAYNTIEIFKLLYGTDRLAKFEASIKGAIEFDYEDDVVTVYVGGVYITYNFIKTSYYFEFNPQQCVNTEVFSAKSKDSFIKTLKKMGNLHLIKEFKNS